MTNLIGQSIGRYHILEQLGEGGMAVVYKAFDTRLDRDVALKVIRRGAFPPDMLDHMLKRFEREAKSLAKLSHPNIVGVIDYGEHEGSPYLVMEYLPGGTLKGRVGQPLPWQEAVRILLPIAQALEYAHEQNLIHRDIKPSNILLTAKGQPMLTDFGIAKILESTDAATLTGTGVGIGTPEYMAPEQWQGQATKQSDIYSLGVVLYEMVTGRKPYSADTPAAILLKQANEPLPRPIKFVPDLPEAIEKILLRALAKNAEDRYQTIGEFTDALEQLDIKTGKTALPPKPASIPEPAAARPEPTPQPPQPPPPAPPIEYGARTVTEPEAPKAPPAPPSPMKKKPSGWAWALVGIGALCLLAVAASVVLWMSDIFSAAPATNTPRVATPTSAAYTCTDPFRCVEIAPGAPIHIAYWGVLSGPDGSLGEDSKRGVEIAIDDRGGQLFGHEILLTTEDAGCNPEGGAAAATKLVGDPTLVGLIGSSCSDETIGGIAAITNAGLTTISPSNTRPHLTDPARGPEFAGYLRVSFNDAFQGRIVAEFAYNYLKVRRAATIHDGTSYAQALQQAFADEFAKLGGTIVAQEAVDQDPSDVRPVLTSIAATGPELIYYPVFISAGGAITSQVRDVAGLENVHLIASDGVFTADLIKAGGPNTLGMFLSSPDFSAFPGDYVGFVGKHDAKYGGGLLSVYHAHAYDAANILFAALEKVAHVGADGTVYIPLKALRDAIYATRNFPGITGTLTCTSSGDCGAPNIALYEIVNPDPATWNPADPYNPNPMKVYP
ncbi:MAG: bifunctional serine/threonine-protein kinase/ABC transporter substrate-binding protein [Chloroflexota bacterium]